MFIFLKEDLRPTFLAWLLTKSHLLVLIILPFTCFTISLYLLTFFILFYYLKYYICLLLISYDLTVIITFY